MGIGFRRAGCVRGVERKIQVTWGRCSMQPRRKRGKGRVGSEVWGRPKWIRRHTSPKSASAGVFSRSRLDYDGRHEVSTVAGAGAGMMCRNCPAAWDLITWRCPILQTGQIASYCSKLFADGVQGGSSSRQRCTIARRLRFDRNPK